jgi:hypothetical protein
MKYTVEMGSGVMMYIPSFIMLGSYLLTYLLTELSPS